MNVKQLARRAWSWLVGSSCQLSVDSCQSRSSDNRQLSTDNCFGQPTTAPRCPHCAGMGRTAYVVHCSCGCGETFDSRGWCPLCGGLGAVPAAVASAARSMPWPCLTELARLRAQPARN
jgi:hypothetical protein